MKWTTNLDYQPLWEGLNNYRIFWLQKKYAWTPIHAYFNTAVYRPTIANRVLISFEVRLLKVTKWGDVAESD